MSGESGSRRARGDVAITGIGVVTPLGCGRERFWSRLCAGESGIAAGQAPDGRCAAARLTEFTPRELISSPHFRRMDMPSRMMVGAACLALADAGSEATAVPVERLGIVVGAAFGDLNGTLDYLQRLFAKGPGLVSPMLFPSLVLNAAASYTAMETGSVGSNFTVAQGEVSGDYAVALGCDLIRSGRADVVLAGGGDELGRMVWSIYDRLHGLSSQRGGPEWCSPYDADRNGVVMGEGAAMLVLESPQRVRDRQATPYAAIEDDISFGIPCSSYGWPVEVGNAVGALRDFLSAALRDSTTDRPFPIDAVFGSANSSRRLDQLEVDILSRLFGEGAGLVSLTSIKGAIGEFAGAGALTAATAALSLRHQILPPLSNLRTPMASPLALAGTTGRRANLRRVMQLSVARGGAVSAILLRRMSS